jgi:hypothetical protein
MILVLLNSHFAALFLLHRVVGVDADSREWVSVRVR